MNYPITPAIRVLRENKIEFEPHVFEYIEKGGTQHSSAILGVDEHAVIKTLIFETNEKKPLIILMHGNQQVSAKNLARILNVKSVAPVAPEKANKLTGYIYRRNFAVRRENEDAGLCRKNNFRSFENLHQWRQARIFNFDKSEGFTGSFKCRKSRNRNQRVETARQNL